MMLGLYAVAMVRWWSGLWLVWLRSEPKPASAAALCDAWWWAGFWASERQPAPRDPYYEAVLRQDVAEVTEGFAMGNAREDGPSDV